MRSEERERPEVAGAIGDFEVEELLSKLAEISEKHGKPVLAAGYISVCGPDHAISAYIHARRAVMRGASVSRDISGEFLRYLTGERQISRAIEKGGIRKGSGIVLVSELSLDDIIEELGLERDDSLLECTEDKARHLGLDYPLPPEEMALELVAMVAIL